MRGTPKKRTEESWTDSCADKKVLFIATRNKSRMIFFWKIRDKSRLILGKTRRERRVLLSTWHEENSKKENNVFWYKKVSVIFQKSDTFIFVSSDCDKIFILKNHFGDGIGQGNGTDFFKVWKFFSALPRFQHPARLVVIKPIGSVYEKEYIDIWSAPALNLQWLPTRRIPDCLPAGRSHFIRRLAIRFRTPSPSGPGNQGQNLSHSRIQRASPFETGFYRKSPAQKWFFTHDNSSPPFPAEPTPGHPDLSGGLRGF